jgi:hypothetical protein
MRRHALVVLLPLLPACASILGFDDLTAGTDGGTVSGDAAVAEDAAVPVDASTPVDARVPDARPPTQDAPAPPPDSGSCAPPGPCRCNGPLAFTASSYVMPSNAKPYGMAAGDFDNDGKVDLVVTAFPCAFFKGTGAGTFAQPTTFACGTGMISAADLDGNGTLDVAGAAGIVLGDGGGGFADPVNFPSVGGPVDQQIAFGDFDGDHVLDVHAASYEAKGTFVFLRNGTTSAMTFTQGASGQPGAGAAVGDLNGDHKLDLVAGLEAASVSTPGQLVSFIGKGDGTFGKTSAMTTPNCDMRHVVLSDLNADTKLDVVTVCGAPANAGVAVFLGNGDGTFQPATRTGLFTGIDLVLVDLDGDGVLDVAAADAKTDVQVLLGLGKGALGAPTAFAAGKTPTAVTYGDFDRDGRMDLAAANIDSENVTVLLNRCP